MMRLALAALFAVLATGLARADQDNAGPEEKPDQQEPVLQAPLLDGEPPEDVQLEEAEVEELDIGEEPLALEEIVVTGERFTLEQETALRLVRQALQEPYSRKRKDRNKWRCWYRKPLGSRMTYMECARNGDLNYLSLEPAYPRLGKPGDPVYGRIYRSQRPVNKKKFREILASLPGSDDFDREFVGLSLAGQAPPRDIPSEAELDDFTEAYKAVNAMGADASEAAMIQAIESRGMTLQRYNRIVELIETYQSLENEVAFRLGTLERPRD
ncbi:MAG: hypothetical protein R3348_09985 [Xanthomonadales bacterium]|nr:hypothetical protein [Xanthomonadales bacterium]